MHYSSEWVHVRISIEYSGTTKNQKKIGGVDIVISVNELPDGTAARRRIRKAA